MRKNANVLQKYLKSLACSSVRLAVRRFAAFPIVIYQRTLSFDHGPMRGAYPYGHCRFYPSCSEYCRRAVMQDGVLPGYAKGAWRIVRCNPFSAGGVDEP